MSAEADSVSLKRELGLFALVVYGVGGMLGGGIYALVGEVAGHAGAWAWTSFLAALVVAAPTGLSYAELASRYPKSGGESVFAERAFGRPSMAFLVGWTVVFSGLVSVGTLAHGFAGYVQDLWPALPAGPAVVGFMLVLAVVNFRGIRQTSRANVVATAVEVTGLLLVVAAGLVVVLGGGVGGAGAVSETASTPAGPRGFAALGVLQGAMLAFYAFIGFEDMINVAEEVRRPRRNVPIAIVLALVTVSCVYVAVAFLATAAVPPPTLAAASAPLSRVVAEGIPAFPAWAFTVIAVFAVGNTALLNYVMASRLAYGMANQGLLPEWLAAVHEDRRTPHRAIVVVGGVALAIALSGTLESLAATTSLLLLGVFFLMNLGLVVIKRRDGETPGGFSVPLLVPLVGMGLSAGLAAFGPARSALAALGVVAAGALVLGGLSLRK